MESEFVLEAAVSLHLGYSLGLVKFVWPIFHIHLGLISRNETAKQWKNREHYIAHETTLGDNGTCVIWMMMNSISCLTRMHSCTIHQGVLGTRVA